MSRKQQQAANPLDFGESSPSRAEPDVAPPPSLGVFVCDWLSRFTAVLLANLAAAAILLLVGRIYLEHKMDQLRQELDRPAKESRPADR